MHFDEPAILTLCNTKQIKRYIEYCDCFAPILHLCELFYLQALRCFSPGSPFSNDSCPHIRIGIFGEKASAWRHTYNKLICFYHRLFQPDLVISLRFVFYQRYCPLQLSGNHACFSSRRNYTSHSRCEPDNRPLKAFSRGEWLAGVSVVAPAGAVP